MPTYFQRPENALKRAQEFIDVGKKSSALDALYDVIKSRKHRTWQKVHEPIMQLYLELCVELKRSHVAKEGLFQYRNICQQINIKSLEDVVRGYLKLAEEKTEQARQESQQAVVDVDDLDQTQTPEGILLSAVSNEGNQERSDRVMLTPWVKFLWESYRQCLELLRNNTRVERLYHDIAQDAFKFCLNYSRKTEFRKLCENLRLHLSYMHRYQGQVTSVNLQNAETQAMHLETRLVQLDIAIKMELWQEAYKATEDIHSMMVLSKKNTKPQLMANYLQKLALVFLKAGNGLYHASALFKHFNLVRDMKKNLTQDELKRLATKVILSSLATPLPPNRPEIDNLVETDESVIDKNQRVLANLLGLPNPPTRAQLVRDLVRLGVVSIAPVEIQQLYNWLETDFEPLNLCKGVQSCIDFITKWSEDSNQGDDLTAYIPALRDMTVQRLLKEISQVYESVSIGRVLELCPMVNAFELETAVVEAVRRNNLQVRIDHKKQALHFGTELTISQREEVVEGPNLQAMPSDLIRTQLEKLFSVLHQSVEIIQPEVIAREKQNNRARLRDIYNQVSKKEHRKILDRHMKIEQRKEELENAAQEKEKKERELQEEKQLELRKQEEIRLQREAEERTKLRQQKEEEDKKKKMLLEKIEQLKKNEFFSKILDELEERQLENLNQDEIINMQCQQLTKERKEFQQRMKNQDRKVDHMERAKRLVELPLLEKNYHAVEEERKKLWEQLEEERVRNAIAERQIAMEHKRRLSRMVEEKEKFIKKLNAERYAEYLKQKEQFDKKVAEEKIKRLEMRKQERKAERREKYYAEKERKRIEAELAIKKQKEAEERARLEAIEAKKREKEREIEEKLEKEREAQKEEEFRSGGNRPRQEAWGRGPASRDDRDREPPQEGSWRRTGPGDRDRDRRDDRRDDRGGYGRDRDHGDRDRGYGRDRDHGDRFGGRDRDDRGYGRDHDRSDRGGPRRGGGVEEQNWRRGDDKPKRDFPRSTGATSGNWRDK